MNPIARALAVCFVIAAATAQDTPPSLLSASGDDRSQASKQLFELIAKRKEEAVKILVDTPVADEALDANSPVLAAIIVLGHLRSPDVTEFLLKHVTAVYVPQGGFSEARLDYIGTHPAVRAIAAIGPVALRKCVDVIEVSDIPGVACILVAMSEAAGSKAAAKKLLQDRLAVSQSKDAQVRMKKLMVDFDKIVARELDSATLKPLSTKPGWEEAGK